MRLQWNLVAIILFASAGLDAQQAADPFQGAHGGPQLGRASRVLIEGTARTPKGEFPAALKISDQRSRLETAAFTVVSADGLQQGRRSGNAAAGPVRSAHPARDNSLLMPFRAVLRLAQDYRDEGSAGGRRRFGGNGQRSRFLGAGPERWSVSLDFDPETGLLAECHIESLDQSFDPIVISYADYRLVEGVAVPFRVRRSWGGHLDLELVVRSVTFQPPFSPGDFEIQDAGGRP